MVFSRFIWTILAFVVTIVTTSVLLGIYISKPDFPITLSFFLAMLVLETALLIYYLTRIRRDLLRLIHALRNEDPTLRFARENNDPYFSAIHKGFNRIIRDFRLVRLDKEAEQRFFEATVNHVKFGLMAFGQQGEVEMVNDAFLQLFKMKEIKFLEDLLQVSEELPPFLRELQSGGETLLKLRIEGQQHHLIFLASAFKLKGEQITLISARDISREIDANELEAWQKLMRVLRHEILNSISPIKLLASNLSDRLQPEGTMIPLGELSDQEIADIKMGLDTIHRRATGLSVFLDAYSNIYSSPEPDLQQTELDPLLERIVLLYSEQAEALNIKLKTESLEKNLSLVLDERMIEQVLMNLVKNALEAVNENPSRSITLSTRKTGNNISISVKDTGQGIPEDQLETIFMPFYSTRERGTGVGLSFSQHVMRLHHGHIRVSSKPGEGSEFQLFFS